MGSRLSTSGGGGASAASVPSARCTNSAAITVPSSSLTLLSFDTTRWDQGTASPQHSTSVNPSRLVCQLAGLYAIAASARWSTSSAGFDEVRLRLNGVTDIAHQTHVTAYDTQTVSVATQYQLALADYVEVLALQTSGVSLTIDVLANYSPEFMWTRLG